VHTLFAQVPAIPALLYPRLAPMEALATIRGIRSTRQPPSGATGRIVADPSHAVLDPRVLARHSAAVLSKDEEPEGGSLANRPIDERSNGQRERRAFSRRWCPDRVRTNSTTNPGLVPAASTCRHVSGFLGTSGMDAVRLC